MRSGGRPDPGCTRRYPPAAAKTGALGNREIIEMVAGLDLDLVVDPVMISKHGAPLLAEDAQVAMRESWSAKLPSDAESTRGLCANRAGGASAAECARPRNG